MNTKSHATHLLEFSVENYRSIRETATLSLSTSPLHDKGYSFSVYSSTRPLLSTIGLFGANASGKSNVLRALFVYRNAITGNSGLFKSDEKIEPFLLDEMSRVHDTTFESCFEYNERMYIYGFSVSTTQTKVTSEWLKATRPKSRRLTTIYKRNNDDVTITKNFPVAEHGFARPFKRQLQAQELFITTISRIETWTLAKEVVEAWNSCYIFNTLWHDPLPSIAVELLSNPSSKAVLLPLLQEADLGVTDVRVERVEDNEYRIKLEHAYSTKKGIKSAWFDIRQQESAGTLNFFRFAMPLLESLNSGTLMVLDELGSTLHPSLMRYVVTRFNDRRHNKHNAQLVFTTHDTSLLKDIMGRDEVYFTAKNAHQATRLYSLSDIKGVRRDWKNLDERYLNNEFGAVPGIIEE